MSEDAPVALQLATGVGPVVTAAGQVVVVQLLAPVAALAAQVVTGTLLVTLGAGHVMVT